MSILFISQSVQGYKHTDESKLKMLKRFQDKSNHPMYGRTHNEETLKLISNPSELCKVKTK